MVSSSTTSGHVPVLRCPVLFNGTNYHDWVPRMRLHILDPGVCYIQDRRTGHLVGTGPRRRDSQRLWKLDWLHLPSLCPPVLSASPVLLRPCHHLLSGIIVWVIFLAPGYLLCFVDIF
jgi:hypothetical protein